jgi:hypothetical protein
MALTRPKYSQIYDTDWKQSVRLATTTDVGNLFLANLQPNTVDSVSVSVNDRILVKDQTRPFENGIYIVRSVGTGSNGWWTRTLDTLTSDRVTSGLTATASEGTVNGGKEFRLITPDPITLNETDLVFINQTGTPGGANTQVQFYDTVGGLVGLAGSTGFTYNKTSNTVTVANSIISNSFYGNIVGGSVLANAYISTSLIPSANVAYDLGSPTNRFRSLYLSGNTIDLGETIRVDSFGTWYFSSQGVTIQMGAIVPFSAPTANISGNINTGGNIIAIGNVTGSYFLGNGSQLTGVITSVTKIINGNATVSAYPSGNISVTPGGIANVVVFATQPIGTTTNAAVFVSGDINLTGNIYQKGNLFVSGGLIPAFLTVNSSNLGFVSDSYSYSEDEGNLLTTVTATYDLGTIATTQAAAPTNFTLPSYTVATLPTASTPGMMIFVINETGGSVPAFSDGTNWRRVTDRAIVS